MSTVFSELPHPLNRAGTSRAQRALAALDPAGVKVDDRSYAELLEYLFQLARTVVYHEFRDEILQKSDWQDFFRLALPFQLALIGTFDAEALQNEFTAGLHNFEAGPDRNNPEPLFAQAFDLAVILNRWHKNLPDPPGLQYNLKRKLDHVLSNDLRFALLNLIATTNEAQTVLGEDLYRRPDNLQIFLDNPVWQLSPGDLYHAGVPGPNGLPGAKGTLQDQLNYYRRRAEALFTVFIQGVQRISALARSEEYFNDSLNAGSDHPAHLGLLYAFLQVFQRLRDDLNRLPERHLDHYLREVLGLRERPAEPDQVHLLLELDKLRSQYPLPPATAFKASAKDANGREIVFQSDSAPVFNQARVSSLRTLYRSQAKKAVLAAPVANSADGNGTPFQEPEKAAWKTLGSDAHDAARVGFFVASPELLLREGASRRVKIYIDFQGKWDEGNYHDYFAVWYTGEKKWVDVPDADFDLNVHAQRATLSFAVPPTAPLVFPDPKVHGSAYGATQPLVRVELKTPPNSDALSMLDQLSALQVQKVTVKVRKVSIRRLVVHNTDGPVDVKKPFMPFGAQPTVGAGLVIGSEEVFRKKLTNLKCKWKLDKLSFSDFSTHYQGYPTPPANNSFDALFSFLINGNWVKPSGIDSDAKLFPLDGTAIKMDTSSGQPELNIHPVFTANIPDIAPLESPPTEYTVDAQNGFMQLALGGSDFRHADYPAILAARVIEKQALNTVVIPNPPYTPYFSELFLTYSAADSWTPGEEGRVLFGHLYPFETDNHRVLAESCGLLPDLYAQTPALPGPLEGMLLLGMENLQPGSSLQLLFQLSEATANPDVVPQPEHLRWAYLSDNVWKPLLPDQQVLADATNDLIRSGIVELSLPFDLSSAQSSILPRHLHWIRVALDSGAAGLADTIGVHAQAIRATALLSTENDTARLDLPLAAGSVSKPVVADAAIKKISQPYDGFGGRPAEPAADFRRRASEHLRHKGRVVSAYDYERLVLDHFPQIYMVKCLTHTYIQPKSRGEIYIAPGNVVLAVIPDIARLQFAEKLQPKASRALLFEIEEFLKKRSTPFVRIKAVNPLYQTVVVRAQVRFKPGKDLAYYEKKLEEDVLQILNPWAFDRADKLFFGGQMFRSTVLQFVENQDYVDYVAHFELLENDIDRPSVLAATPRSIIAAGERKFKAFTGDCPEIPEPVGLSGLGYQKLGNPDFKITAP